ncbi:MULTISPECIES: APC family permease [unclassified Mycolicibacterium]|uniref:APC family permease n=1 Tax=unclassified Mycolicibacterium TaxID=2636767 RepID=UPI001391BC0A|nr:MULTISPECIES: APC family permease [unclassified Mycolicibacterium]
MSDAIIPTSNRDAGDELASPPTDSSSDVQHLGGRVGATSVVLTVMAFLAPLGAVVGYVPLVIGYGNGLGAPAVFLMCGAILALFLFGFLAMVRQVPRPGAFYAYVSSGLGKRFGLGSGSLTLVMYLISLGSFQIFGGIALSSLLQNGLGVNAPWWVCVTAMTLIVGFCSYRGIDFNVRVLGCIVAVEVVIIVLFDLAALALGARTTLPTEPFTWSAFNSGSVAVAALFAIAFFIGFESTAIYREEVRNPSRTIPLATYIVTAAIAVFYFVSTYCLITVLGVDKAVSATSADPSGSFTAAFSTVLGHTFSQVVAVLVVTSVLASQLAMTNGVSRYVYSFGVDRVLPSALGAVHHRHGSPHRAAVVTTVLTGVVVILVALSGMDAHVAYGVFSGVAVFGFEVLMLLVSLAVIVYFRRNRGTGESLWSTVIAPLLSIVCFGWLLVLSAQRADVLLGTPTPLTTVLFAVLVGAFVVGVGFASWCALRKPDTFARIGRAVV